MKTILLVEDDAALRQMVQRMLGRLPCRLVQATDGAAAVALARQEHPDLILLDLVLPGMDGWAVLQALRDDATTQQIPVVLLTGTAGLDPSMVRAVGAVALVAKPFTVTALQAQVQGLLGVQPAAPARTKAPEVATLEAALRELSTLAALAADAVGTAQADAILAQLQEGMHSVQSALLAVLAQTGRLRR